MTKALPILYLNIGVGINGNLNISRMCVDFGKNEGAYNVDGKTNIVWESYRIEQIIYLIVIITTRKGRYLNS